MAVRFGGSGLDGQTVTLSVNGGPNVTQPVWGGGGDGGTITITVQRTKLQVAPDSVLFEVDLSQSNFDTQGPVGDEVYDARLHDLIYLWDLDDPGNWTAPTSVLATWRDRSVAKGPFVGHMYTQPKPTSLGAGNGYNPSVLVIEPSSGKTATASVEVFIEDPDVVYAGTDTICINPVGDNDFTGKPTGAAEINLDFLTHTLSEWTSRQGGNAKRWLFKSGETFTQNLQIGSALNTSGITFGSYGASGKATIRSIENQNVADIRDHAVIHSTGNYGLDDVSQNPDLRVVSLRFSGNYDPVTMTADGDLYDLAGQIMFSIGSCNIMFSDVSTNGFAGGTAYMKPSTLAGQLTVHFDNCDMTDLGGQYPLFYTQSTHEMSAFCVTGIRMSQNPDAQGGWQSNGSTRSMIRCNSPHRCHIRGSDFFHTDQSQFNVKVPETPEENGILVNIHSSSFEGGDGGIVINGNHTQSHTQGSTVHNVIVDGVVVTTGHSSQGGVKTSATGVTFRNSLINIPATAKYYIRSDYFFRVMSYDLVVGVANDPIVWDAPVRAYSNTFVNQRTDAQNNFESIAGFDTQYSTFNDVAEFNNVVHQPNIGTPVTTFAPLSTNALWPTRDKGYRFIYTDEVSTTLGSAVANNATLTVAYPDYYLNPGFTSDQSLFSGTTGRSEVTVGGVKYFEARDEVAVTYNASDVTIQNTSGAPWANGASIVYRFDMGTTAPVVASTVPPAGSTIDAKPLAGSAALGAATTDDVAYDALGELGTARPATKDAGAWQAST